MGKHTSYLIPHTSYLIPHTSYLIPHTSYLIPHTSYLIPHTVNNAESVSTSTQEQVANKVALTEGRLQEAVDSIREAVHHCFPEGLPPYDPVRQELEDEATVGFAHI